MGSETNLANFELSSHLFILCGSSRKRESQRSLLAPIDRSVERIAFPHPMYLERVIIFVGEQDSDGLLLKKIKSDR